MHCDSGDVEFDMPEPVKLMVAGDWHRIGSWALEAVALAKRTNCDAIVHVGDFGYWPSYDEFTQSQTGGCYFSHTVREAALTAGIPVYWLDGNHENHDALYPGQGDQWLRHLPRGHRWQWWGRTWMAAGGAVSVDQKNRTPGFDWFPDEVLSWRQAEYCMREGRVDVILSHDCPASVQVPGLDNERSLFPEELIAAADEHRLVLAAIVEQTRPGILFHGHYHRRYNAEYVFDGFDEDSPVCRVIGLDKAGTHLDLNTVIITKEDLP